MGMVVRHSRPRSGYISPCTVCVYTILLVTLPVGAQHLDRRQLARVEAKKAEADADEKGQTDRELSQALDSAIHHECLASKYRHDMCAYLVIRLHV